MIQWEDISLPIYSIVFLPTTVSVTLITLWDTVETTGLDSLKNINGITDNKKARELF